MNPRLNQKSCLFLFLLIAAFLLPFAVYFKIYAEETKLPAFGLPMDEAILAQGKKTYELYCIGCHGAAGDGKGPAAGFLNPKPRNFQLAEFRISSRPAGSLPTDEDLYNSLALGLHGTSMPSWKLVPENDRWAVIAYIKSFAKDVWKNEPVRIPTAISEDPFATDRAGGIKKGETAYHGIAACYSCHPAYVGPEKVNEARAAYQMPPVPALRANPGMPEAKPDSEGNMLKPPDFTWDPIKRKADLQNLYLVIANGISGTAMPSWKGILAEEDIWGMAYYIQSLAGERPYLITDEDLKKRAERIKQLDEENNKFEQAWIQKEKERKEAEKKSNESDDSSQTAG